LAGAGLACLYWVFGPSAGAAVAWDKPAHFLSVYGLTMLGFAAFPHSRRTDLVKIVILVGVLAEIVRFLVGSGWDPVNSVIDTSGALAVLVPSFMERFRSLARADPREPFSMVYPNDRRQRESKTAASSQGVKSPSLAGTTIAG
jgi:hypothetical protein